MHDGDKLLSGNDHKFWALHHHLVVAYGCYTFFKYVMPDISRQTKGHLWWFVPFDHPDRDEVIRYLEHELEKEQQEPISFKGSIEYRHPGTDLTIDVLEFRGVQPHIDRDLCEKLSLAMIQRINEELKKADR